MARSGSVGAGHARLAPAFVGRLGRQHAMVGHASGDRAHDVERVERRHARARFGDVEARIREIQALASPRRSRSSAAAARRLPRSSCPTSAASSVAAPLVEQQRILARPLRHDALGEARHEDDAERAAARLMRRADEQPAVAARRRLPVERDQPIVQDVARFFERRPARRPPSAAARRASAARAPGRRSARARQRAEPLEPLAPRRLARASRRAHRRSAARTARRCARFRRSRSNRAMRADSGSSRLSSAIRIPEVGGQAVEPPPPARLAVRAAPAADHRRLDDQLFPLPRRPQRARHDRLVVRIDRIRRARGLGRAIVRMPSRRSARRPAAETLRRAATIVGTRASRPLGRLGAVPTCGTWPSDRYSSKRFADSPSHAHDSSATNARPAGSGRRVPRSK